MGAIGFAAIVTGLIATASISAAAERSMRISSVFFVPAIISVTAAWAAGGPAATSPANDYPTSARAEYVFACMQTNGQTRQSLQQCSCSIDVIASLIPYDSYVAGETVASMDQEPGQIGGMFRGSELTKEALANLRRAQAEAEVRCF